MFQLQNVSKHFNGIDALKSISFLIPKNSTTVLIGPSGCGKSTVLRLMIGLVVQDTGKVIFNKEEISQSNILNFRRKIGYVIQDGGLFPHMSVKQNISLMAEYLKQSPDEIQARISFLCELTQFPLKRLDAYPVQLSGGQKQRVSLMRALMLDPAVLLLDEPLGALDPMVRSKMQRELKRIFQDLDKTVIMVTHDIGEAAFFGDSIILMNEGAVIQQGTMTELLETPNDQFVEDFINAQRNSLGSVGGNSP